MCILLIRTVSSTAKKSIEKGEFSKMAELLIKETRNIIERVAEQNKLLGDSVSLWLKKGPEGECILRVVPCTMSTTWDEYVTTKGVRKKNWVRKLHFNPSNFDFGEEDIIEDVFVPVRKKVKQAVLFYMQHKEKGDFTIETFKMETINAYLEDGKGPRNERVKDLPNDLKEELLQQATEELVDYLLAHAKQDVIKVVESTEAYCAQLFN